MCFHLSVAPALSQFSLFVFLNIPRRLIDLILILLVMKETCSAEDLLFRNVCARLLSLVLLR